MNLICPICGEVLRKCEKEYVCENRHSFDIARQGYVNLLTVQQKKSLHPGDTREQVLSRRAFLEGGFYEPIVNALCETAKELGAEGPILDVGCGEGYYCTRLAKALDAELTGIYADYQQLHDLTIRTLDDYNAYLSAHHVLQVSGIQVEETLPDLLYYAVSGILSLGLGVVCILFLELKRENKI